MFTAYCPFCCFCCSTSDEYRAETRVEDHIDKEHADTTDAKRIEVVEI